MSKEFPILHKRIERLKNLHVTTVASFNAYETIIKLRAPNILGIDEARANTAAIGRYKGFFNVAEKAMLLNTLMCLSKVFIAHKDSLYLEKIINYTEQNRKTLTVEDFKEFYEDRPFINELIKDYNGLSDEDVKALRESINNSQESIAKLKIIRDQQLAHMNLKEPDDILMTPQEIIDLIGVSENILKILSYKHFHNIMVFDVLQDQAIADTMSLVHLARFENENCSEVGELMEKYCGDYATDLLLENVLNKK